MKIQYRPPAEIENPFLDLTVGNIYRVIEIVGPDYRIMSDEGLPYLYPREVFEIVHDAFPKDWEVVRDAETNDIYASPPGLFGHGFFEEYFEGNGVNRGILRKYLSKWRKGEE